MLAAHRRQDGPGPGEGEGSVRILDWIETQSRVSRVWLDQLIAEGDPDDLVSLIHRQAAWLDLMRQRLKDG